MRTRHLQPHIRIGIDEPPHVDNGLNISKEKDYHIVYVGQKFTVNCIVDFQFTVTALDGDRVELDCHADAQTVETDPASMNSSNGCSLHFTLSFTESDSKSFGFRMPGDSNPHFSTIDMKLPVDLELPISDTRWLEVALKARDEGRWHDALCVLKTMKHTKPPRGLLLRCRYQAALQVETGVPEQGIRCNQELAYNRMRDLFYDVKYTDAIHDEVVRTLARYHRDGIGVSASPSECDRLINAYIMGVQQPDNTQYEGPVDADGQPHGEGTMYYYYGEKQKRYTGHFEHGVREGQGELCQLATAPNPLTESEYYMQGDYDGCGRQISSPPPGSYEPYHKAWYIDYKGLWHNDRPLTQPEE